jgi:hypothetical protein
LQITILFNKALKPNFLLSQQPRSLRMTRLKKINAINFSANKSETLLQIKTFVQIVLFDTDLQNYNSLATDC